MVKEQKEQDTTNLISLDVLSGKAELIKETQNATMEGCTLGIKGIKTCV